MKKKLLCIGIAICILLSFAVVPVGAEVSVWDGSIAAGFESGSGTEEDPYIIKTAPQLAYLSRTVNNGRYYVGEYVKLANDIVLNTPDMFATDENGSITGAASGKTPIEWTAIGCCYDFYDRSFSGTFDGGNHEIKGLYISKSDSNFQGLFGYCKNATVKNVGVTGGYICANEYVGGVIGYNYVYDECSAIILNCYNTGRVTGVKSVGGVLGRNDAYNSTATASNCYNTGIVTGEDRVGGVVGQIYASNSGTVTVSNCYNTGSVTGNEYVGGVIGYSYVSNNCSAIVSNCYNTGSVTGNDRVSGVVGSNNYNNGMVVCCYNTGPINGNQYVSGVVGENLSSTISDCYNTGNITGDSSVGGVVGMNNSNGVVLSCYNIGSVYGNQSVGGVGGTYYVSTIPLSERVKNCYFLDDCAATVFGESTSLTDLQMKQQSYFDGFDFDTVWTMEGNPDYPYPELIGMYYGGEAPTIDEPTIIESGTCGDNLTWTLDDEGTLIISGTGAMTNEPWSRYKSSIKSLIIENGVTYIRPFSEYSSLTSVTIGNSITSIANYAFYKCNSLTSIEIPDSVTSIGENAFSACTSLASIEIPDSVTSIASQAFNYCTSLNSIILPNGVISISYEVFHNTAYYNNSNNWESGILYIGNHLISAKSTISGAVSIREGTKTIADCAFWESGRITSIEIPNTVIIIGSQAFASCFDLTSITIPDSVTSIGRNAFYQCSSLTTVTIGNGVTSIGDSAFVPCYSLKYIEVSVDNQSYSSEDGVLFDKEKTKLICCPTKKEGRSYIIPDGVMHISDFAFAYCSQLSSITLPDSMSSIGANAFMECYNLRSITIPDNVTFIGEDAFSEHFPIYVSENNQSYSSEDGVLFDKQKTTLICFPRPKSEASYTIPDSVTTISQGAFFSCFKLASVTIPDSVTSIGGRAFYYCESLTSVNIPDGVTGIGEYVFYNCKNLTSVEIPESVTYVSWYAFYGCKSLTDVYYGGSEEDWSNISIGSSNQPLLTATKHFNYVPTVNATGISIDNVELNIEEGGTVQLVATVEPENATDKTVIWASSNETAATVDGNGIVAAVTEGVATITATANDGGFTASCVITVIRPTILGDVNGDKNVNVKDDAFLARYLAHWIGYDETNIDLDAADVNADGKVGVKDNVILARFIAKWTGYEELPYLK